MYDYAGEVGGNNMANIIDPDVTSNHHKLSGIKAELFAAGADFSFFKALLSPFAFDKLAQTTESRVIDNIEASYADFVTACQNAGFDITKQVSVVIENDVWIGARVTILPGVQIARGGNWSRLGCNQGRSSLCCGWG